MRKKKLREEKKIDVLYEKEPGEDKKKGLDYRGHSRIEDVAERTRRNLEVFQYNADARHS